MEHQERYIRQLQLPGFGKAAQQKLEAAKVLVIGAGGLGVPVLQYLAAMGTGTLGIVDGDSISRDNLHRQVLYADEETGLPKAETAARHLQKQNPHIRLKIFPEFFNPENATDILSGFDLVVDATDNFAARYLINDACVMTGKPFIYGAVQQYEGQVSVFNYGDGPTYRCLYPVPPAPEQLPDCNTAGVLGVVPGIIGCRQALEAVKVITGIGTSLSGYLLILDFLNNDQYRIRLKASPERHAIRTLQDSYAVSSCGEINTLSPEQLYGWYGSGIKFTLLDVRSPEEYREAHLENAMPAPPDTLTDMSFPVDRPVVTVCRQGSRSLKAARLLRERYPALRIYSLAGGIDQWIREIGAEKIIRAKAETFPQPS
ncbi:HesA/MoeB/ThiF family protein [Compostibacter hankyongensis]|uniref:Molybdopterin-synthase adenylyltransferase MoeB n=1 Tax=Compostibacter hankyongensis TaxID=1007089 RepID=A0ABP8FM12_9BACT